MSDTERFDDLILGSGTGGTSLALHLAGSGRRVAVVERHWIGGSCPNIACLPSKNETWSAKVVDLAQHYAEKLDAKPAAIAVDMAQVRYRKRTMVSALNEMVLNAYRANTVELLLGEGRFVAKKTLEVRLEGGGARVVSADRVFLNLGTHAAVPNIPGLLAANAMTHIEALELDRVPAHLIVLGGGNVGIELGQAFRRFGSDVTIVEHGPQLLAREDSDVAAEIANVLMDEGINIVTSARTRRVEGYSGQSVRVVVRNPTGERTIAASDLLLAVGRVPNTAGIGLEAVGIDLDKAGYIKVNERLETSAADVWAIGECAGSPQFTHVSYDDFRVVRDNLAGGSHSKSDRLVPYCIFTDPPIGRVGLNETEARSKATPVRIARLPMADVLRTRTTGETTGFMKAVIDASSDRILGFAMVGADAGEVIAVVQTAMLGALPYTGLRDAVLAHPTMAEGLGALFSRVPPKS
jgi:pyruvate/2-oxoglutarate dehydrogenase complex dihydrolipoamide dehydrogenase (E3) component